MDQPHQNRPDDASEASRRSSVAPSPTDVRSASRYESITGRDDDDGFSESYQSTDTVRRRPDATVNYGMCDLPLPVISRPCAPRGSPSTALSSFTRSHISRPSYFKSSRLTRLARRNRH